MKKIIVAALSVFVSFMSLAICAQNYYFLRGTAIARFTEEDAKIYIHAQETALNKAKDGSKVSWSNPKTSAHGYFIPSKTAKKNGDVCRKLTVFNYADHRSGKSAFTFCKIKGAWKVVS